MNATNNSFIKTSGRDLFTDKLNFSLHSYYILLVSYNLIARLLRLPGWRLMASADRSAERVCIETAPSSLRGEVAAPRRRFASTRPFKGPWLRLTGSNDKPWRRIHRATREQAFMLKQARSFGRKHGWRPRVSITCLVQVLSIGNEFPHDDRTWLNQG